MQNVIQIGQAQPTALSQVKAVVKSVKVWLNAKSVHFSAIAGEEVSHRDVVQAHLYLLIVFVIMLVSSKMGGDSFMTYEEYMQKVDQFDQQTSELKIEEMEAKRKRNNQMDRDIARARDDFYLLKHNIEATAKEDRERIHREYADKRRDIFMKRSTLVNEWRQEHPIPANVVAKAYELLAQEGGTVG